MALRSFAMAFEELLPEGLEVPNGRDVRARGEWKKAGSGARVTSLFR